MIELSQMLEEYRAGERGLPSYDELMTLLNAPAGPLAIFQSAEQNEQLARDAQAALDAAVAAMATFADAWTPGKPAASSAQDDAKDAERWREVLMHVGATVTGDIGARFTLRFLEPVEGTDLMRGGVAGHFTDAIDAAIAAKAAS